MSNIVTITLNDKVDRKYIDDCITNAIPIDVEVLNLFSNELEASQIVSINAMDATQLEAFKVVVDQMTFTIEADALVWNIERVVKDFYLAKSYVRTAEDTTTTPDDIPDGSALIARFEIPGFETNKIFDLSLWFNQDFSPTELTALEDELQIVVTGDGLQFNVVSETDFKISFIKPDALLDVYVINSDSDNVIIER